MLFDSSIPWKPAAITMLPSSSASRIRSVEIERMRALVWMLSVMMPIWAPVRLIALWPSEWMAIAISATLTCSPVDSSMSISRAGGSSVICLASSISAVGVLAHGADDHHHLIAFASGADGLPRRGEDFLAVGHAGAAELLNDDRHG